MSSESVVTARGGLDLRPRREDFLVFGAPLVGEEEIAEVVDTLRSGWIGTGPKTKLLEDRFRTYVGSTYALAVSSCTAGLHLALDAFEIGEGDEVITTPMTFAATANVIVHTGATPIFADVDLETMNLSPDAVEDAITPRTKAVIAVHMAGRACEMDELRDICDRHRLRLIADAAHAVETQYRGDPVSRFADVSVYSFYATKNITTAEGGMVVTDDHEVADRIAARRLHGINRDAWKRYTEDGGSEYETLYPGFKYNLTDLQSSLGLHQLARVEDSWSVRRRHVAAYRARLEGVPGVSLPTPDAPENRHAHHLFNIFVEPTRLTLSRNGFADALRELNIGTGIHFTPIHLHAYYRERFGFERGSLPNAEWIGERTLSLPLSAALSAEDVADVADAVCRVAAASNAVAA